MEWILIVLAVCLLIAFGAVCLRLLHFKRELRHFSNEIEKLKNCHYAQPVKITCFDKDITHLAVKLNEYVDMQQKLSAEYVKERIKLNNVISGVSHDFRTPLTASLGYLQLIDKSGNLSDKNKEYLTIATQKNKYLKELSDEFFELSTLENENEEIIVEEINLSNLLMDMLFEQYSWLQEKAITPEIKINDGIIVKSNASYLTRIIQNLMSNAEKYAVCHFGASLSENEGRISLVVYNDTDDSDRVQLDKVFEPFYKSSARNNKGTGLGLYVVKRLSDKLGYTVMVKHSEDNIFSIEILI